MRKLMCVLLASTLLLGINAWGEPADVKAKAQKTKKCLFPKSRKRAPAWVCYEQEEGLAVTAVGSFHKSGAGREFMEQMATADARAKLVQKLNAPVQKKIAESGAGNNGSKPDNALIDKISDETLQGTKLLKKAYGPKGKLYVLIGFDAEGSQKLQDSITAAYQEQKRK